MSGMPVPATIRTELHELALRIESERASAQRFAAGVFLISHSQDEERARIGLMNLLLNTPEFAGAWIEDRGRRGVVVFAHKALFERITRNWVAVPALAEAAAALGAQVSAGSASARPPATAWPWPSRPPPARSGRASRAAT